MGAHLVEVDGIVTFQSDKYPSCPAGKVPLSVKDKTAQDLLWEYAQRRRAVDAEFADDLEAVLRGHGFQPDTTAYADLVIWERRVGARTYHAFFSISLGHGRRSSLSACGDPRAGSDWMSWTEETPGDPCARCTELLVNLQTKR